MKFCDYVGRYSPTFLKLLWVTGPSEKLMGIVEPYRVPSAQTKVLYCFRRATGLQNSSVDSRPKLRTPCSPTDGNKTHSTLTARRTRPALFFSL